ncbi:hypothetical protein BU25DRAFT_483974 [Macroventuria anomochaeta]|uniref:Uncharacterized protein n=1 Tax=Macroventuria anomochaeta TaxID=301207 RepID=A0ACB6RJH1_9PLEO|nr:uncharacterized protein BU25DRAFT_483974 [Macroventuria anomochaeta]KAF2621114.1 hypothetical protein BU25DRAFT_483974 [Macroventuria anomochaeta]
MLSPSTSKTAAMEAILLSSHSLMGSPIKRPSARPRTPPPTNISSSALHPSTPRSQKSHKITMPATPRQASTPTTPCVPRKRSLSEYDPSSEPVTPKRARTTPRTHFTPSKPSRGRKKKVLTFDHVTCIPMHVLRAQKDDTSALLRPLPRRSDALRKLVDISIESEMEKIRSPGCTGILEAAVWSPKKGRGVKK